MVFTKTPRKRLAAALRPDRELDMELVHAQRTRRISWDRLVANTLSPHCSERRLAWGLSGRPGAIGAVAAAGASVSGPGGPSAAAATGTSRAQLAKRHGG